VHVAGDDGRPDLRAVAVANVEEGVLGSNPPNFQSRGKSVN
jgi:hypothetical protein